MAGSIVLAATLAGDFSYPTLEAVPDTVTLLKIQADLSENIPSTQIRKYFSGELLYSVPDNQISGYLPARHQALVRAAQEYDLVELDADHDLLPHVLTAIPSHQRVISWKGKSGGISLLRSAFARMSQIPARLYSLTVKGSSLADGVAPLALLKDLGRRDVVAICEGKSGVWSRLLAPYFGAPLIFGKLDNNPIGETGELSVRQLIEDYGFPSLHPVKELYGIVGNRVFQSPSPRLHNAGYRSLKHAALFLPFYVERFEDFSGAVIEASALDSLGLTVKGLTVVSPYKETAFATATRHSSMASRAAASNLLINKNGSWEADTTDPESLAGIMRDYKFNHPFTAAVVGCGGAGRAIAAALQQAGADVTLVNRGRERGELAVKLLGLPFVPLTDFKPTQFSLVVNATPVGRDDDCMPFDISSVDSSTVVVDLVYGSRPALLVESMAARGCSVIDGYDVLLHQVRKQFKTMTGLEMPAGIGRHTIASGAALGVPLQKVEPHNKAGWLLSETDSRRMDISLLPEMKVAKA